MANNQESFNEADLAAGTEWWLRNALYWRRQEEEWRTRAIAQKQVIKQLREAVQQAMTEADIYRGLLIYNKPWEPKHQESWKIMQQQAKQVLDLTNAL